MLVHFSGCHAVLQDGECFRLEGQKQVINRFLLLTEQVNGSRVY